MVFASGSASTIVPCAANTSEKAENKSVANFKLVTMFGANLLNFCNKAITNSAVVSFSFSRSDLDSEKKATSVPEISPEISSSIKSDTIEAINGQLSSVVRKILEGSGSNDSCFDS